MISPTPVWTRQPTEQLNICMTLAGYAQAMQAMHDRRGNLNNMTKVLIRLVKQAGSDRNRLVFVLEGELADQN